MSEEREKKGKDELGRFTPGNTYSPGPIAPDEPREVHPKYPNRDRLGRVLPGAKIPDYKRLKTLPPNVLYRELHGRLLDAVEDSDISQVYEALFALTQGGHGDLDIQLKSIKLYLDRFFGQPQMTLTTNTTETKVNVDLGRLTNDELQHFLSLSNKVQTTVDPVAETIIDITPEPPHQIEGPKEDFAE